MINDVSELQRLIDKDAIRDLVLLYSRAVDRKDIALLRDLYTADATDSHGDTFDGLAREYCDFIEASMPYMPYSGHHVCNHMISVDGNEGNGEVYALAYHLVPDRARPDAMLEDFMCVRYIDNYRRDGDGKWRFTKRVVTYDLQIQRPFDGKFRNMLEGTDPSYHVCKQPPFQQGARN
ncbi:MAG: nuclear transport factor 2 family protein [Hyphomicrobiales bacterium]|nr:MAG: nuclear transport factor 2 family protein [Hyphomicrobiales bacterium]